MSYSCVSNGFYFSLRSRSGGRSAQTYEECWNLNIFSRFGPFLQFFGQAKEWLKLELYGMIGMSHVFACLMLFILHLQGRIVKDWGVLGVFCRGQFKMWITLNFADIVNFVSLILWLIVFFVYDPGQQTGECFSLLKMVLF